MRCGLKFVFSHGNPSSPAKLADKTVFYWNWSFAHLSVINGWCMIESSFLDFIRYSILSILDPCISLNATIFNLLAIVNLLFWFLCLTCVFCNLIVHLYHKNPLNQLKCKQPLDRFQENILTTLSLSFREHVVSISFFSSQWVLNQSFVISRYRPCIYCVWFISWAFKVLVLLYQ